MPLPLSPTSAPWALLGATGFALGLGVPLGKQAVTHAAAPLAFALWPALSTIVVLGLLAWRRHGAPTAALPLLRFGGSRPLGAEGEVPGLGAHPTPERKQCRRVVAPRAAYRHVRHRPPSS